MSTFAQYVLVEQDEYDRLLEKTALPKNAATAAQGPYHDYATHHSSADRKRVDMLEQQVSAPLGAMSDEQRSAAVNESISQLLSLNKEMKKAVPPTPPPGR